MIKKYGDPLIALFSIWIIGMIFFSPLISFSQEIEVSGKKKYANGSPSASEQERKPLKIWPNPLADHTLQFEWNSVFTQPEFVAIRNFQGNEIYMVDLKELQHLENIYSMPLPNLDRGLYMVVIRCGNKFKTGKLRVL